MQIETLLKVPLAFLSCPKNPIIYDCLDRVRNRQEGRGAHPYRYEHTPRYTLARLTFRSSVFCLILSVFPRSYRVVHCRVFVTNCTETVMILSTILERTEIMICLSKDIRDAKIEQAVNVERGKDGTA